MVLLVFLLPILVLSTCLALGASFGPDQPFRWWFLRLGLVPCLCSLAAFYIMLTPAPVPLDYDESIHPDTGLLDFGAIIVWGLALPIIYLLVSIPVCLAIAGGKREP